MLPFMTHPQMNCSENKYTNNLCSIYYLRHKNGTQWDSKA